MVRGVGEESSCRLIKEKKKEKEKKRRRKMPQNAMVAR